MTEYAVINPATGEKVRSYPTASDQEIGAAVDQVVGAHAQWSGRSIAERAAIVRLIGDLHIERSAQLGEAIVREMGKPLADAVGEVEFSGAIYQYYADHADGAARRQADHAAGWRGVGLHPSVIRGRAPGHHAVELPGLPGGAFRWP